MRIARFHNRARERGARVLSLDTNEQNQAAQALYRGEGLRPDAHERWPGGREVRWFTSLSK